MDLGESEYGNVTPIYNRYLRSDFTVGQDNLNPLREVDIYGLQADAYKLKLLQEIQDRLKRKTRVEINLTRATSALASSASDLGTPYDSRTILSSGVALNDQPVRGFVPSLQDDVESMYRTAISFLDGIPVTVDELPFDLCNDRGQQDQNAFEMGLTGGGAGITLTGILTGAGTLGLGQLPIGTQCLQLQLEWLQQILAILNFINVIVAYEQYVIAFIYPIYQIIAKVVGLFFNPALMNELVMDLVGIAIAAILDFVMDFIQTLLGSLNLECLFNTSLAALQKALGLGSGIYNASRQWGTLFDLSNPDNPLATVRASQKVAKDFFKSYQTT